MCKRYGYTDVYVSDKPRKLHEMLATVEYITNKLALVWSNLGHLGLPDLVASTFMDASNSHADGRADKPSDSRLAVSISNSNLNVRTVTQ